MDGRMHQLSEIELDSEMPPGFDCGNSSINLLVKSSFFPHLFNQQKVYKIVYCDRVIGCYSLSITAIRSDEIDLEYETLPIFGAIKLNYIAVDKQYQHHGIGSVFLERIILKGRDLSRIIPVRILILDALPEKVSWYESHQFITFTGNETTGNQSMYIDLLPTERLEQIRFYSES